MSTRSIKEKKINIQVYLYALWIAVWCRSAHTRFIDNVLNGALRIVTGSLRTTSTDHLPMLSGIQSAKLCRVKATFFLDYRGSLDPDHTKHGLLSESSDTRQERLRSRRSFVAGLRNLLNNFARLGIRACQRMNNNRCNMEYCENKSRLPAFIPMTSTKPVGITLP